MSTVAVRRALDVACRTRGHSLIIQVHELDAQACSFSSASPWLKDEDRLSLRFPSGIAVTGQIGRVRGGVGRVSFDQALHPSVVAHLGYSENSGA